MERLPREIFEEILLVFAHSAAKNEVLSKRLVCRDFNNVLRTIGCRTLSLETTRLSRHSSLARPRTESLQTIGHRCKALHIDMSVVRDDSEVELLTGMLHRLSHMEGFCRALRHEYSFSDVSFTEDDFYQTTTEILFYCRHVDRVRICLPFPVLGRQYGAATRILANALKALGQRPEEDSAPLQTLVIEGLPKETLCWLWGNPSDVSNMHAVLASVETLVIGTHRFEPSVFSTVMLGIGLWNVVYISKNLRSFCLADCYIRNYALHGGLEVTKLEDMEFTQWLEWRLPGPTATQLTPPKLTYLEIKHASILPEDLLHIAAAFGPSLEELHMLDVYLMTQQSVTENTHSDLHLWVGLPNTNPGERQWMAMRFRALMPKLRVCRCSSLGYKVFRGGADPLSEIFDYADPAGLGRTVAQRFVEVVTGLRQPPLPSGKPMYMHPHDGQTGESDHLMRTLTERRAHLPIAEHDYHAHRLAVAQGPDYQYSLDGLFRNCTDSSLRQLQNMSDKIHGGMADLEQFLRTAGG